MASSFSSNLLASRKRHGVSQKKAAEVLGISQALLSHYEKGIRECGLDFVVRAAEYYEVSCDYLLGLTDEPLPAKTGNLSLDLDMLSTVFSQLHEKVCSSENPELQKEFLAFHAFSIYLSAALASRKGALSTAVFDLEPETLPLLLNAYLTLNIAPLLSQSDTVIKLPKSSVPKELRSFLHKAETVLKEKQDHLPKMPF